MRSHLERKGIKTASGSLAVMLTGISAQAAPVGIVTAITTSSIAAAETLGAASGILGTLTQLKTQAVLMKTQIAIGTLATAVVVTPLAIQQSRLYDLREENKNLRALVSQQSSNIQNTAIVPTENLASYTANAPVDVIETLKWQTVESDDYHKYIANLRSIGVPEETIRDIIVADVTKFYAKRMKEFRPEQKEFEFWNTEPDSRNSLTPPTKEQLENQLALVRERRALLKELLGEDYHDQPDMMQLGIDPSVSLLDFLPLDKRIALQELDRKYSLARPGDMSQTQEDLIESLNERQRLKELELSRILTPEEEFEYNLRMSSTAQTLRAQLDGFNPTKEEFLQMYLLKKAHDEQWEQPRGRMPGEEELQNMQAARENLQTEFKNLLGPERYSEYERAQDSVFQSMLAVTRTLELPEDTAARIYNVKQATQEYVNQLKSNPDLSEQEIENALQQIGSETQKEIIRIAGEDALQLLQNESGGRWLRITGPGQTVPTGVFSDPTVIGEGTVIRRAIQ